MEEKKAVIKLKMELIADKFYYELVGDHGLSCSDAFEEWHEMVVTVATEFLDFCNKKGFYLPQLVVRVDDKYSYMLAWTVRLFLVFWGFDKFKIKREGALLETES